MNKIQTKLLKLLSKPEGYNNTELAKKLNMEEGYVRLAISSLRDAGYNVAKRLEYTNGRIQRAKYYIPNDATIDVCANLPVSSGRPSHDDLSFPQAVL